MIARLPEGRSLVFPGSACPRCKAPIRFYDNVPILSYVNLRGRCRSCKRPIPLRYPLVEGVTAILFGAAFVKFGPSVGLAIAWGLVAVAVAVAGIDARTGLILDVVTIPLIVTGLVAALTGVTVTFSQALAGGALGAAILAATNLIWKEGMGWGDVKYVAGLGTFFGPVIVLFTVVAAALIGSVAGGVMVLKGRKALRDRIPFGPSIAGASVLTVFAGPAVMAFLLR